MKTTKKMSKKLLAIGLAGMVLAFGLMLSGCTTFQTSGIEVHQAATEGTVLGGFDINVPVSKFLGMGGVLTLFNIASTATDPKITNAIRTEIQNRGGTAAINVKIEYKASFLNLLLNVITLSIYSPGTAHVTGTIIK